MTSACNTFEGFKRSVDGLLDTILNKPQNELQQVLDNLLEDTDDFLKDKIRDAGNELGDVFGGDTLDGQFVNCAVSSVLTQIKNNILGDLDNIFNATEILKDTPIADLQRDVAIIIGKVEANDVSGIVKDLSSIWNTYKTSAEAMDAICGVLDAIKDGKKDICKFVPNIIVDKKGNVIVRPSPATTALENMVDDIKIPKMPVLTTITKKENLINNLTI